MHRIRSVAKDLHFDMARRVDEFFDQHGVIAERALGLIARACQRCCKSRRIFDQPHPLAAAARDRLDKNRIADLFGRVSQHRVALIGAVIARHNGHACRLHQSLRRVLQPHRADRLGRGSDKHQSGLLNGVHKIRVLRQEPITRMDRLCPRRQRCLNNRIAAQIAFSRGRAAQGHRQIARRHMKRAGIHIRMHRDRLYAHIAAGPRDAARDLAPVCNQNTPKHQA